MRTTKDGSERLRLRARLMSAFGKGLLALDTPPTVLAARLRAAAVVPTAAAAAAYRATLLETPELATQVSGVVLAPPDLRDVPGVLVGVRADTGFERLGANPAETVTTGLDGLAKRLEGFRERGAAFAVWATSTGAAGGRPALRALAADAAAAARFACACQDSGLVPVVRVGTRFRDARSDQRRELRIAAVMVVCSAAADLDVDLSALLLSTTVEPGDDGALLAALPPALGGVALGPSPDVPRPAPCPLTFYAGRAVTWPALQAWGGRIDTVRASQNALWEALVAIGRPAATDQPEWASA